MRFKNLAGAESQFQGHSFLLRRRPETETETYIPGTRNSAVAGLTVLHKIASVCNQAQATVYP